MTITEKEIKEKLIEVIDQKTGKNIMDLGMISSILIKENDVSFILNTSYKKKEENETLQKKCKTILKRSIPEIKKLTIIINDVTEHNYKKEKSKLDIKGVKNIITITSGKGGVGKSTVAVNLAFSLIKLKHTVAIIDSDIYGPSIPKILGTEKLKPYISNGKVIPIEKYGLHTISIGYFIDQNRAAMWRGPLITKILYNLLMETKWTDIEYLIIDTPPGTGDIHLSLIENFNLSGTIIVLTPQKLALIEAYKIYDMYKKFKTPIIGIIENMSHFIQGNSKLYIFGKDGGKKMCKELGINLLGKIPLDAQICNACDYGNPLTLNKDLTLINEKIAKNVKYFFSNN